MGNLRDVCFLCILASAFKCSVFGGKVNYVNNELPYRVQESILEYSDDIGDRQMTGPIRKIYRKDLDENYAAYFELQFGNSFYIFAAGAKTKDHRLVQSGETDRPTDLLIEQAAQYNKTCYKFFRLCPDGVTICEDCHGKAIATTMDLNSITTHVNLTTLAKDVSKDLQFFKEEWEQVAKEVRSSFQWKATKIYRIRTIPGDTEIVSQALELGTSQSLSIGTSELSDVEIYLHYNKESHPNRKINPEVLCSVLENICTGHSTKVNVEKILNTKHNLYFIKFKVNDDYDFVAKKLQNKDAGFYFKLKIRKKTIVVKYYSIRLSKKRVERSVWSSFAQYSIPREYLMPDYDQHKCCGDCLSGCTPVAWAQIFAYYDILASSSIFSYVWSPSIWQGADGVSGSASYVADSSFTVWVKKYVEEIRKQLQTFCDNGGGATYSSRSVRLNWWFRRRQFNGLIKRILKHEVDNYVKMGYPVMNNIVMPRKEGHSVVITKIKERERDYYHCRKVGWWWGRRSKCDWKKEYDYQWYRRMGWGGLRNSWSPAASRSAFVAIHTYVQNRMLNT